ncbi:MAG TPA: 30S ribosomal protein S8e [Candidatus Bathyarchaeia archaeon]|nr:MAG: 30S ribosomal protein S8e [Candidatus Bathyarchaeota archaeon RBG_16_48_13]HJX23049.1 30S ribosomal protein S8e [Candidatus Bathyarchaeia archaeon]
MPQWHGGLLKRKRTGGRTRSHRRKRSYEIGSLPAETIIGETDLKVVRAMGGNVKYRLKTADQANVTDPATKKTTKVPILRFLRNPANIDYNRRGVITKGALIETELGEAEITSQPGVDGVLNAILRKAHE